MPTRSEPPSGESPPAAKVPAIKGRGVSWLVEHRFTKRQREPVDDGWFAEPEEAAAVVTTVLPEHVRSILSGNQSPDIPFDLSINPYRGCEHGCTYCYARPTHGYLDLSPGLDFETRIIAKMNAAEVLRQALCRRTYVPSMLNVGSVTDPYQPVERKLGITRAVIEVLAEANHAFSLITKSSLIERDLDVLAPMAAKHLFAAYVSITTLDPGLARTMEPRAASPARRLRTVEALAKAGIPVGVSVSPVIPFLNEPELERILEAAANAGASRAFSIVLRLPWEVNPVFQQWLQQHFPEKAARIMARVRDMRAGRDNDAQFGSRMIGTGLWAELIRRRFERACASLNLNQNRTDLDLSAFRAPNAISQSPQGRLF